MHKLKLCTQKCFTLKFVVGSSQSRGIKVIFDAKPKVCTFYITLYSTADIFYARIIGTTTTRYIFAITIIINLANPGFHISSINKVL